MTNGALLQTMAREQQNETGKTNIANGKKNESRRKMEISKLLVFLVFSLPHSIALPLFRISFVHAIVVVLHRYFSLFMWFVLFSCLSPPRSLFHSLLFVTCTHCNSIASKSHINVIYVVSDACAFFFGWSFFVFLANARFLIFLHCPPSSSHSAIVV